MSKGFTFLYAATDKEIFDVLMSSKQSITESVMLELAKDRGIFYSPKCSREKLAISLSLLPHDYNDLSIVLNQREHAGRLEKITSITLNGPLSLDDIKEVTHEYMEQASSDEKIINHQIGTDKHNMTIRYPVMDYSKTRLVQRRTKEASIEFIVEGDKTIIRMPANDKAKTVVEDIKNRLDSKKKADIPIEKIELTSLTSSETRTEFFTSLISKLPNFKLDNVTSLKVESSIREIDENAVDIEDDQEIEKAEQEMLALVKAVALKGQSLLLSAEYKQLKDKGFYITSIIWRSKKTGPPYEIIELDAGFEEPEIGKGFKYNVRGALHFQKGVYTKTLRPVSNEERQKYLSLIEVTARDTLAELCKKSKEEIDITEPIKGNNL